MKKFIAFTFALFLFCPILAQEEDIKLSADYEATLDRNEAMAGNGGVLIVSPYDDLVIQVTSGNVVNENPKPTITDNGQYEYPISINIDKGPEAHFIINRKGSTTKAEFSEKRLRPDYLLGYRVKSVSNPIRLSYQPNVGDMYPSATEGMVEISTAFEFLNIQVPKSLPFEITSGKQENDESINVYKIIVPVGKIKELQKLYEQKSQEFEELDNILIEGGNGDDPRWKKLDQLETEVAELQASVASVQQIDVSAPESNSLSIDISQMGPRSKMVVAVVPLVQTIIKKEYKNPYDGYMAQAQNAYDLRKYGTAKNLYLQANQAEGITSLQATTAQECATMMDGLSERLQTVKNCASAWKRMQKEGKIQRHLAEDCLELAMTNLAQLFTLTHDDYYEKTRLKYQKILSDFPVVIEGTIRVKDYDEGVMHINSLTNCEIYACSSKKDKEGTYLGRIENDGTFHVQFERGHYIRLLLKPLSGSPLRKTTEIKLINDGRSSMTIKRDITPK